MKFRTPLKNKVCRENKSIVNELVRSPVFKIPDTKFRENSSFKIRERGIERNGKKYAKRRVVILGQNIS